MLHVRISSIWFLLVLHVVLKCKQVSISVENMVPKQTKVALIVQCLQLLHQKWELLEILRSSKEKQRQFLQEYQK